MMCCLQLCGCFAQVIRWALLFWTRSNPAAYDELANVLTLPSRRTLRGYRNHLQTGGFDEEALGRIAAKHRLDDADEMAQLLERHTLDRTKMLQLAGKTAGKVLVEWMAERHLHERALKAAQLQWGWKCCVCFDSASLRQSLLKNGKTGEIDGFEDLFSVAAEEMSVAGLVEDRKQEIAKVVVLVVAVVESEYHRARVLHRS